MDLFTTFINLPLAQSAIDFTAIRLSMSRQDFLAKGSNSNPVFLLHDATSASYLPAIELKNVSVQFHTTCRVTTASESIEGQFAVVSCSADDPDLYEVFIKCFTAAVEQLPKMATTTDLQRCIHKLLDLFRSLNRPSSREITGLWAELFLISQCNNISKALLTWHTDPTERYDFSWLEGCIEVKATVKELRQHEFSLEQLQPLNVGCGFIASLLLQPMSGGVGVIDLANTIDAAVNSEPTLRQKLWENIAITLGNDYSERLDRRFSPHHAERNIIIYAMKDIPAPMQPIDSRVTNIRFRVDLTTVQPSINGRPKDILQKLLN